MVRRQRGGAIPEETDVLDAIQSTQTTESRRPRSAPFDPVIADRLLDLLSTDDAFRRRFKKRPDLALADIGHVVPQGTASPYGCFFGVELASKARIAEAREQIRSMLQRGLSMTVPVLDSRTR